MDQKRSETQQSKEQGESTRTRVVGPSFELNEERYYFASRLPQIPRSVPKPRMPNPLNHHHTHNTGKA